MSDRVARNVDLIRFNVLRNALYHTARRRYFERWNRVFNFAVVVLGAAAIADMAQTWGVTQAHIGVAVALVGALQLVCDFGGSARTHQVLQRDYYNLLAEIEESAECTEDECRKWEGRMHRIAGDEPPTLRAIDAKAYNDTIGAMEWSDDERLIVPWYQKPVAWLFSFNGHTYQKKLEIEAKREAKRLARADKASLPAAE